MPKTIDDVTKARALQMISSGKTTDQVASALGVSGSWVSKLRTAASKPASVHNEAPKPRGRPAGMVEIARLSIADQLTAPDTLTRLAAEVAEWKAERAKLDAQIQRAEALVRALMPSRQMTLDETGGGSAQAIDSAAQ